MRRARGSTLLELIAAVGILIVTILLLGQTGSLALTWHETQDRVIAGATGAERIRKLLGEATREGKPVDGLSVLPSGEIVEKAVPGADPCWSCGDALVLRGSDAWWVIERKGTRLLRRRIGFDGHAEALTVATGLSAASFAVETKGGQAVGISYKVSFAGASRVTNGFVALRIDEAGASPPSGPRTAPRWGQGGGK